jgi:hypothetical protein
VAQFRDGQLQRCFVWLVSDPVRIVLTLSADLDMTTDNASLDACRRSRSGASYCEPVVPEADVAAPAIKHVPW